MRPRYFAIIQEVLASRFFRPICVSLVTMILISSGLFLPARMFAQSDEGLSLIQIITLKDRGFPDDTIKYIDEQMKLGPTLSLGEILRLRVNGTSFERIESLVFEKRMELKRERDRQLKVQQEQQEKKEQEKTTYDDVKSGVNKALVYLAIIALVVGIVVFRKS